MIKSIQILILIFFLGLTVKANQFIEETHVNIIPKPLKVELRNGEFIIDGNTRIVVCTDNLQTIKIVSDFAAKINKAKHFVAVIWNWKLIWVKKKM